MKKIVVTVIGADSVGIVAGVTKELALQNINILDISQTILDGIFDMILICDMEKAKGTLKDVQDALGMLVKNWVWMCVYSLQTYFMLCIAFEEGPCLN
mgnify:CR=1 FL=1